MPILTRATDLDCDPEKRKPLEHVVACASCRVEGPAVLLGPSLEEWQTGRHEAVAEAKRAGFREVRDVDGGHFADWICGKCAGGLL